MKNLEEIIQSGVLEMYVLGCLEETERLEVESLISQHPSVQKEIISISREIEKSLQEHAIPPDVTIKPFLLAVINYMERLKKGEQPEFPPVLNERSTPEEYAYWTSRSEFSIPPDFEDFHAKIIGYTPEVTTAIVWIRHLAPHETHTKEYEKFLILEGTCDIIVEEEVHSLKPGDYFPIPLYKSHLVKVTSKIPCKVILQRIAA